jgi:autotransporter-associated beta strand protein
MRSTNSQTQSFSPTVKPSRFCVGLLIVLAVLCGAPLANATLIVKTNNTGDLNLATSWTNSVVPGASDIAQWDSTVTAANTTLLGGNMTWGGMKIINPGGPVVILTNASGNVLTLGTPLLSSITNGIDMSQATTSLMMSNNVTLNAPQNWYVTNGQTLTLNAVLFKNQGAALRFYFPDSTAQAYVTTNGNVAINYTLARGTVNYATVNDTDYAVINNNGQIVGGATIIGPSVEGDVYSNNMNVANGATIPTALNITSTNGLAGWAVGSSTPYIYGMRFDCPSTNTIYLSPGTNAFNGYPAWSIVMTGTRTITCSSILVTTNCGNSAVLIGTAGSGNFRMNNSGVNEMVIFQNNPAAPLVFMAGAALNERSIGVYTKLGVGTMDVRANGTYTGGTRVYEGKLRVSGAGSIGIGPLNVYGGNFVGASGSHIYSSTNAIWGGATNTVEVNAADGQFICSNLMLAAGSSMVFTYSNTVPMSTTTAPLLVAGVSGLAASNTVSVSVVENNMATGVYPLIKYPGTVGGDGASAFTLGYLPPRVGAMLSNDIATTTLYLVVTNVNQPLRWATSSGTWDVNNTANWKDTTNGTAKYQSGWVSDAVRFDDTAAGGTVTLNAIVAPASVIVSNNASAYTISGLGSISGVGGLTKSGLGTLTLRTTNGFAGGVNLNGGIVNFATLTNLGLGAIGFGGGTLQYASGNTDDISVRSVTFNTGGATIDTGGNSVTIANPIGNNGTGGLTKTGLGTLTVNGTNNYTGNTVVNQGTLALGITASLPNGQAIIVGGSGTLDATTASNGLTLNGITGQILAGTGTVNGGITNTSGTTISPATNGVYGALTFGNNLTVNSGGAVVFDISTTNSDLITVNGTLTLTSGGLLKLNIGNTLTNGSYKIFSYGSLSGAAGNLALSGFNQPGQLASLSSTGSEIDLVVVSFVGASLVWQGDGVYNYWDVTNKVEWLSGATQTNFHNGDNVTFNDSGSANWAVSLMANVYPGSVTVSNTSQAYLLEDDASGAGKISGFGGLTKKGAGNLLLSAVDNNTGPTVISAGTVQVGDGGGHDGSLGTGNITNNSTLVFDQTSSQSVNGQISGTGTLVQFGSTILTLMADNIYSGQTIISNGAVQVGGGGGGGTLGTGAVVDNGTLIINRTGSLMLTNNISGSGQVIFSGPTAVTLGGANTYLGNTYVSNGVVKLNASEVIPDGGSTTGWLILDGGGSSAGVLDLNGFNETVNALSGLAGTVLGQITNSSASSITNTLAIGGSAATTYNGQIVDNSAGGKVALAINGGTLQLNSSANTYSGGTIVGGGATLAIGSSGSFGSGGVVMSNGATFSMPTAVSAAPSPANAFTTVPDATATFSSAQTANALNGPFIGGSTATNVYIGSMSIGGSSQFTNFYGTVVLTTNANGATDWRVSGTPCGSDTTTFNLISGSPHTRQAQTIVMGALFGSGNIGGPSVGGPAAGGPLQTYSGTFIIGGKNIDCTYDGSFTNLNNLVKSGTGRLTLDGYVAHTGTTTVSNGVLVLAETNTDVVALGYSPLITLAADTAVIDVSAQTDGLLIVTNQFTPVSTNVGGLAQVLAGIGTINGSLWLGQGCTNVVGNPTGILTVTNVATLDGVVRMAVNRTSTPNSSRLVAGSFVINSTATLTITNAGAAYQGGEVFTLFSAPVSFTSVTLPPISSPLSWSNKLNIDGTIVVLGSLVNTNPPYITNTFDGTSLTLSWPADHNTGWRLQAQTNKLSTGLSNNWVDVANPITTNKMSFPVNSTNGAVFYRMIEP